MKYFIKIGTNFIPQGRNLIPQGQNLTTKTKGLKQGVRSIIWVRRIPSRRAPANWGRVVTFLQFLARVLLSLAAGAYVGDLYFHERNYLAKSGFWAFEQLCSMLRFHTSDRMDRPPSVTMHLLGARCRFSEKRNSNTRY